MKQLNTIERLVVHGAYTRPSARGIDVATVRRWHTEDKDPPWDDIGYHFFIPRSGALEFGRSMYWQGAHAPPENGSTLGVCLAGGRHETEDAWQANYNGKQYAALQNLAHWLRGRWPDLDVVGHGDVTSGRECPGFEVIDWWKYARGNPL